MKTRDIKLMSTLTSTLALVSFIGATAVVVTGLIASETAYARRNLTAAECATEQARNHGGNESPLPTTDISYNEDYNNGEGRYETSTKSPGNVRDGNRTTRGANKKCLPRGLRIYPKNRARVAPVRRVGTVQRQAVKKARSQKKTPPRKIGIVQPQPPKLAAPFIPGARSIKKK